MLMKSDVFGYQITLSNKNGTTVQTSKFGGAVTWLIYVLAFVYIIIKGQKMFEGNLDIITTTEDMIDLEN